MATHSAFLRETGIDWTMSKGADKRIGVSPGHFNPNAAFGNVYWVDENTGDNASNGLTPTTAFATLGQAVTVNNAEVGNYNMNTIYINSQTYTETLTTYPKQCHIIGIGSKVRVGGVSTFSTSGNNVYWHNIQFRQSTAAPTVTLGGTRYYGGGFFNCVFDSSSSNPTYGIQLTDVTDFAIENCIFKGNHLFPTAIHIAGICRNFVIQNNIITAETNGIKIGTGATDAGYQNFIIGNYIARTMCDPNSTSQMTYGIRHEYTSGTSGYTMIGNYIDAVDAISFVHDTGTVNADCCIGNHVVQAGTADVESDENA